MGNRTLINHMRPSSRRDLIVIGGNSGAIYQFSCENKKKADRESRIHDNSLNLLWLEWKSLIHDHQADRTESLKSNLFTYLYVFMHNK